MQGSSGSEGLRVPHEGWKRLSMHLVRNATGNTRHQISDDRAEHAIGTLLARDIKRLFQQRRKKLDCSWLLASKTLYYDQEALVFSLSFEIHISRLSSYFLGQHALTSSRVRRKKAAQNLEHPTCCLSFTVIFPMVHNAIETLQYVESCA